MLEKFSFRFTNIDCQWFYVKFSRFYISDYLTELLTLASFSSTSLKEYATANNYNIKIEYSSIAFLFFLQLATLMQKKMLKTNK